MTYDFLMSAIKAQETPHIHALPLPQSCSPSQIPESFSLLIPDIVTLLETYFNVFCDDQHIIGIFSLQPTSCVLTSPLPAELNRVIQAEQPTAHFCCVLSWLKISLAQSETISSWQESKNILIDFTTGAVMDEDHCLTLVLGYKKPGTLYGYLPAEKLATAWKLSNAKQCH